MLLEQSNPENAEENELSSAPENESSTPTSDTSTPDPELTTEEEEVSVGSPPSAVVPAVDDSGDTSVGAEEINEEDTPESPSAETSPQETVAEPSDTPPSSVATEVTSEGEDSVDMHQDIEPAAELEDAAVVAETVAATSEEETTEVGASETESAAVEPSAEVGVEEEVVATPSQEQEAETADAAEPKQAAALREEPEPEVPEGQNPEIWGRMKEILADKNNQQILSGAQMTDLVAMMAYFIEAPRTLQQVPRVGLVKRTYDALKYQAELSEEENNAFLEQLATFNKKRVEIQKQQDDQKKQNATQKEELLRSLQAIVDTEDPLKINEVREIQNAWRNIGQVPREKLDILYKQYRFLLDTFYKQREMHFEMLEYDRKINLQEKERIIKEVEQLIPGEDKQEEPAVWKEALDTLKEYQQMWKAAGHVPREEMERINNSYREAVDRFFEVRQGFMEKLDEARSENAAKKEAILAEMAKFSAFEADRPRAWNDATRELKTFQDTWKETGQAPYAQNNELWNRYKEICNAFFTRKAAFFKQFDDFRSTNLELKRALCEKAEAITQAQEWEKGARELKRLQKEWKEIGPVPERHSNKLWERFRTACDSFFEQRRQHYQVLHEEEYKNLDAKKQLIEEVKGLIEKEDIVIEEAIERVKQIQQEWRKVGKVPYKEKDKIWDEFRGEVDAFFNGLSGKRQRLREKNFTRSLDTIEDPKQLSEAVKERIRRIRRKINQSQEKVDQYSNNIQFISKGKSGDALRAQIQKEIDEEKSLIADLKKQIKDLREKADKPKPKAKAPEQKEKPAEDVPVPTAGTEADEATPVEAPAEKVETETEETESTSEAVAEQEVTPTEDPAPEEK